MAPHPDSQGTRNGHGPGLRGPGPYRWGVMEGVRIKGTHSSAVPSRSDRKQLPDNRAEALLVLDYARHMVVQFLDDSSVVSDSVSGIAGRDNFTVQ